MWISIDFCLQSRLRLSHFNVNDQSLYVYLSVCVSLESDSPETIEVTIITFGRVAASGMLMHHVIIILTLTFIPDHTDLNHENMKCSSISETVQAMTITFAVKIVRLKVYMSIACPMTLTFI